jgi:hypothetical protein
LLRASFAAEKLADHIYHAADEPPIHCDRDKTTLTAHAAVPRKKKPKKDALVVARADRAPSGLVAKYRDELDRPLGRKHARDLVVGDVLYPRGAVVQSIELFETPGEQGAPSEPRARVLVRYKGRGLETFVQEVAADFEYLLWKVQAW